MIQVFKPCLGEEEFNAVREAMRSGWIGLGPKTKEFEDKFAEYLGCRYVIGLNSGTAALHLALLGHGIGLGDEVIVPSLTFVSTVHAVRMVGATPVFADVYRDTLCLDVNDVARKITARTKVILPVHYGGHPVDLDELHELADHRGIVVIEDAAHAAGAQYKGRRIGNTSETTCYSFHAVKNLTMGEGGAVATNNQAINDKLRRLRWVGISKDTWSRSSDMRTYGWYYEVEELGYKYHLSDIPASIGLVQLGKLEKTNCRRRELVQRYNAGFAGLENLETPVVRPYVVSACHNYVIKSQHRDRINLYLKEKGIATSVHYMPAHMHPYYKGCPANVPVTDAVWKQILTLPLYPDLTNDEVDLVVNEVKNVLASA